MSEPAVEWRELSDSVTKFVRLLSQTKLTVSSVGTREHARLMSQRYFGTTRQAISGIGLDAEIEKLDACFREILHLADARTSKWIYLDRLKPARKMFPDIVARIEMSRGVSQSDVKSTEEDKRIIETLNALLPTAALSYQQAIADLADDGRVSFRGPALELRETLRSTLDHLAPDKAVEAEEGYKKEEGRFGPTMKQKVRFIRKHRGQSKSSGAVPEHSVVAVDEIVGTLTRSIYELSSVATHVAGERKAVIQIKRFIVAILHEILEI
jgi:hypothetical protein